MSDKQLKSEIKYGLARNAFDHAMHAVDTVYARRPNWGQHIADAFSQAADSDSASTVAREVRRAMKHQVLTRLEVSNITQNLSLVINDEKTSQTKPVTHIIAGTLLEEVKAYDSNPAEATLKRNRDLELRPKADAAFDAMLQDYPLYIPILTLLYCLGDNGSLTAQEIAHKTNIAFEEDHLKALAMNLNHLYSRLDGGTHNMQVRPATLVPGTKTPCHRYSLHGSARKKVGTYLAQNATPQANTMPTGPTGPSR